MAPGTRHLTPWRCRAQGHVFERTYNLVQALKGCPICSGRVRKTPADYHALAKERGMRWIGTAAPTTNDLTDWQCAQGSSFHQPVYVAAARCWLCDLFKPGAQDGEDYQVLLRARRLELASQARADYFVTRPPGAARTVIASRPPTTPSNRGTAVRPAPATAPRPLPLSGAPARPTTWYGLALRDPSECSKPAGAASMGTSGRPA